MIKPRFHMKNKSTLNHEIPLKKKPSVSKLNQIRKSDVPEYENKPV